MISPAEAITRARTTLQRQDWSDPVARLRAHVKRALPGASEIGLRAALLAAEDAYAGGSGHMQTAITLGVAEGMLYPTEQDTKA